VRVAAFLVSAVAIGCADPPGEGGHGGGGASTQDNDLDGWTPGAGDCDDADARVFPGADETCNGVDDDCDGEADEDAVDAGSWYADDDGDGYGSPNVVIVACAAPEGHVDQAGDCADSDAERYPGATETWYDGTDQDCAEDNDHDADADGALAMGSGGDDCDDLNSSVYPGAVDAWYDGVDSNCDGADDFDADGDGLSTVDSGGEDCDDADAEVHPGAAELCNDGVDSDCTGADDCVLSGADVILFDSLESGDLGATLAAAGDLDGDGARELLIGAPSASRAVAGDGSGFAFAVPGPLAAGQWDLAAAVGISGTGRGSGLGSGLAPVGDTDGDGYDDVLVGSGGTFDGRGAAWVVPGPWVGTENVRDVASGWIRGVWGTEWDADPVTGLAGYDVAAGDVNGDGRVDLIVPEDYSAYVALGPVSGGHTVADADTRFALGPHDGTHFGRAVATLDADGDGFDDVLFGQPQWRDAPAGISGGRALLFLGPLDAELTTNDADLSLESTSADGDARIGEDVANGGDLDDDGLEDAVIGATAWSGVYTRGGAVFLVAGGTMGDLSMDAAAFARLDAPGEGARVGARVAGNSDVNGDGQSDLLVGGENSALAGEAPSNRGASWLLFGPLSGAVDLTERTRFDGAVDGDRAGVSSLALPGDLNGDGIGDIAIGADGAALGEGGAVYVLFGG
jgi:hypothetical protein